MIALEDTEKYLSWGKYDHDELVRLFGKYSTLNEKRSILDFGCSSGRVLRHFEREYNENQWSLFGCDIQARAIQWIRQYFPKHYNVINTSTLPHLPFEDESIDFIYGFSVVTHVKYQWDAWLMELRRVLKPGGLMMQTVHTENAWKYYYENSKESWVQKNHTPRVYENMNMDFDFLYFGDACVSQVFWKRDVVIDYWGRYFKVLDVLDPPKYSFQDWVIVQK